MANLTARLRAMRVDPSRNNEDVITEEEVTLAVVSGVAGTENASWSSGEAATLTIRITNPAALGSLVEGQDYVITFEPATDAVPAGAEPPATVTDPALAPPSDGEAPGEVETPAEAVQEADPNA